MGTMLRDIRFAVRGMGRNPGFTAVVMVTLGLGIGAATAIFSVADAALLRPLPFPEADRLVDLAGGVDDPTGFRPRGASYPEAADWRSSNRTLDGVAAWSSATVAVSGEEGDEAELLTVERVTADFFPLLGAPLVLGRTFSEAEHRPDGGLPVVLSNDVWLRRFGGDPDVTGRTILLADRAWTVVGVAGPGFRGVGFDADLWVPLETVDDGTARGERYLSVVGRLRSGVGVDEAAVDLRGVAARLAEAHPDTHGDRTVVVAPFHAVVLGETRTLLVVLLAAVGFLLLIACANVTNLLLVRSANRSRELLLRRALGAGRGRVVQQVLTESLVLALAGAVVGWGVALAGVRLLRAILPVDLLPAFVSVGLDSRALMVGALATGVAGLAAGLVPALRALHIDPATGLREGGNATGGVGPRTVLQPALVVVEVALALVLLVGTGLMARSLEATLSVETGVEEGQVAAFRTNLPPARIDEDALAPTIEAVAAALRAVPGVEGVAWSTDLPLRSGSSATFVFQEGREADEDRIRAYVHRVSPDFFQVLGIPVLAGRILDDRDLGTEEADSPVVISRAMARRFWGENDPVGGRLRLGGETWLRIVGVVGDARFRDLTSDLLAGQDDPDVYLPFDVFPSRGVEFAIRTQGNPEGSVPALRQAAGSVLPGIPLQGLGPLDEGVRQETAGSRFGSFLLGLFALLASILAAVGLYGVLSASVGLRGREIAIRMAVGADARRVRKMVVVQGMRLVGLGVGLGLVTAAASARTLEAFLYGVRPIDPATYAAVALLLTAVALAATVVPALRATRVDPQRALSGD